MKEQRSLADILADARRQKETRRSERAELPTVSRFTARFDSACQSGIAPDCSGEIVEDERAGYVNDDPACEECCEHAQEIRDDFFSR